MPHLTDFWKDGSIVSAMSEGIYDDIPQDPPAGRSRRRRLFHLRRRAELITTATRSPAENRRSRERIYLIIQLARIPLLALSGLALYWGNWPVALLLFTVSVPLPAVAVIIANEKGEKLDKREKHVYKPGVYRELEEQQRLEAARQAELERAPGPDEGSETIDAEDPDTESPKES